MDLKINLCLLLNSKFLLESGLSTRELSLKILYFDNIYKSFHKNNNYNII